MKLATGMLKCWRLLADWKKTKQQRYSRGQVCRLLQVRHESGSDIRFYGGSGWCLSASTSSRLEPPVWNPQLRKTGPVSLPHDVSHDAGRRSPAEEAGGSSRKTRRRLRLKTQWPAIKLLHKTPDHKAAAYYLWVAAERMGNEAFSTFSFSTHAVLSPENSSVFGHMTQQWRAA